MTGRLFCLEFKIKYDKAFCFGELMGEGFDVEIRLQKTVQDTF